MAGPIWVNNMFKPHASKGLVVNRAFSLMKKVRLVSKSAKPLAEKVDNWYRPHFQVA